MGAPQRIRRICLDITGHYGEYIAPNGFKAQMSRSTVRSRFCIKKIPDELNGPELVAIISSNNSDCLKNAT